MKKKLLVLFLLTISFFMGTSGIEAKAQGTEIESTEVVYINPLYENVFSIEDITESRQVYYSSGEPVYLESVEDVAAAVRDLMEERATTITVYLKTTDYYEQLLQDISDEIFCHTGEPTEGDYLKYTGGYYGRMSGYGEGNVYYLTITYTASYFTTAEQEAELDIAVDNLLDELDLYAADDYTKVRSIYDYMCDNIVYDFENLNDETYLLQYTAYAALVDKTAVCQGYANLFYRLALELDVDARIISGYGGGPHAWNIVELDDWYYNLDATWDAGYTEYDYFLRKPEEFTDHIRNEEYETAEFHEAYPMSEYDYEERQEKEEAVEAFVNRLYELVLGRPADSGSQAWVNVLMDGSYTGAQVAESFIFGPEFSNKQMSNEEFVQIMYSTFLDRPADADGLATWTGYMEQGYSRRFILSGFVGSGEFQGVCDGYGIVRGDIAISDADYPPAIPEEAPAVNQFVELLYSEILGRPADADGLNTWTTLLLNGSHTGAQVAEGFVMGPEFMNKQMSNAEFVQIMYRTFLTRPADSDGLALWTDYLEQGYSKRFVFAGFVGSAEFQGMCDGYGIIRGDVTLTDADFPIVVPDQQPKVSEFVERLYSEILGRPADADGLNAWVTALESGSHTGAQVAESFILSKEFQNKDITNEEYVQIMYRTLFGRDADPNGLTAWVDALENGYSKHLVFAGFANSAEFGNICAEYGIQQGEVVILDEVPTPEENKENPYKFLSGDYITTEPITLDLGNVVYEIDANVYVPGHLEEATKTGMAALEKVSGVRFDGNGYCAEHGMDENVYIAISRTELLSSVNGYMGLKTNEFGFAYVLITDPGRVHLAPGELLLGHTYTIMHELSHVLMNRQAGWFHSVLLNEGFAEYTTYKMLLELEESAPEMAYYLGRAKQNLMNMNIRDSEYEELYKQPMEYWFENDFPIVTGSGTYAVGMRFMAYLEDVYGSYSKWITEFETIYPYSESTYESNQSSIEQQLTVLKSTYGEDVLDNFYSWLKEYAEEFAFDGMMEVDRREVDKINIYPLYWSDSETITLKETQYQDLYINLETARKYMDEYKKEGEYSLVLTTTNPYIGRVEPHTVNLYQADGSYVQVVTEEPISLDGISYIKLVGEGTVMHLDISGFSEVE